jgi:hypothetical protein
MKLVIHILLCSVLSAGAQSNNKLVKLDHYVMDSFANGVVKQKTGQVTNQVLNYNLITKEMIFEQGGQYLAIAHPENIDTVFINQRKFVPVENAFYEYLAGTTYPLFAEYTCKVKEPGAQTGFGKSNTTAAVSMQSLIRDGGAYGLKLPDEFEVIPGHSLYIRMDGKYLKIKNEQQLVKLLPGKKDVIREWVKNNKTNFSRNEDAVLLIQQIQQ